MVDSDGQYYFGTTDVTRTISLNNKENKVKEAFTIVLQGHLNLTNFKLTKNTSGEILDKFTIKK